MVLFRRLRPKPASRPVRSSSSTAAVLLGPASARRRARRGGRGLSRSEDQPMSKSGLQTLPKVRRSTKEVESMKDERIYLLAELTILPEFLERGEAILKEALGPDTPGSQVAKPYNETGRDDDPHKAGLLRGVLLCGQLMSSTSNRIIQKRLFASLDGKVSGVPTLTKLKPTLTMGTPQQTRRGTSHARAIVSPTQSSSGTNGRPCKSFPARGWESYGPKGPAQWFERVSGQSARKTGCRTMKRAVFREVRAAILEDRP